MDTRRDTQGPDTRRPNPIGSLAEESLNPTEARQGHRGSPVLMVLIAALVLAVVAWGAAEWWGESTDAPAEQTATPPAGDNRPANADAAPAADPAAAPPPAPAPTAAPSPTPGASGSQGTNP